MDGRAGAPLQEWQVAQWFNTPQPLRLAGLRGRVVLVHAFQMLCPGCVAHGLPLAARVHELFGGEGVAVVGLHCVFEHHDAMQPQALRAFIHEYRWRFPIGVDEPSARGPVPCTMSAWSLEGTPSTLLVDRDGRLRLHRFGAVDELQLGAWIGSLLAESPLAQTKRRSDPAGSDACDGDACPVR